MEKGKRDTGLDSFETIVENILGGIGMFEVDKNGKMKALYLNNGFYRMIGYSRAEAERYLKNIMANIIIEDRQTLEQGIADVLKDDGWVEVEFRAVTKDGGLRWYQVRANLYARHEDRSIFTAILLDATERKSMEEELTMQAERLNLISQVEGEHIFDYNAKTDILVIKSVNREIQAQDLILNDFFQKKHYENVFKEDRELLNEVLQNALKTAIRDTAEVRIQIEDDDYRWYRLVFSSIVGNEGYVTRIVGRLTNIHENKLKELELEIKAQKDTLTELYNKGASELLIKQALHNAKEQDSGKLNAMFVLDLDNFKSVNDNLGHAYGDLVLHEAAKVMKDMFKGRDIVGRVGGDEFVIFMYDIEDIRNAYIMARKLCRSIKKVYPCEGKEIVVTASIGIAICDKPNMTYEELFERADRAMYISKNSGKNNCTVYSDDM